MNSKRHCMVLKGMALAFLFLGGQSRAELLVEETFDYAVGNLNGQSGGTGWGGAWSNPELPWSVTSPGLAVPRCWNSGTSHDGFFRL